MKNDTTFRCIGGTWYARVPPGFAEHLGLKGNENGETLINGEIQDEEASHGKYISVWVKDDGNND